MYFKGLTAVSCFLMCLAGSTLTFASNIPGITTNEAIIEFALPLDLSSARLIPEQGDLKPRELLFRFGELQGGYTIPSGEDMDTSIQRMLAHHRDYLYTAIAGAQEIVDKSSDASSVARAGGLLADLKKAEAAFESGQFTISGMRVANIESAFDLLKTGIVNNIKIVPPRRKGKLSKNFSTTLPLGYEKSFSHESWAPYQGSSQVTKSKTFQTFYFNNVSAFGSTTTYEHETQVYDSGFADYDNYWASNLPSAYYDTPFADSIDNFTVGSAQASSIQPNVMYNTYMALTGGTSPSATVRIKGQIGHRSPSWCYSTWCIWPDATTGTMVTFTAPLNGINYSY